MKLGWRIWFLLVCLLFSLISIFGVPPNFFEKGITIKSVDANSTAFDYGLRPGQIITAIDNKAVNDMEDYTKIMSSKFNSNISEKTIITTKNDEVILLSKSPPEIFVSDIPRTNLKLGLDLAGGARALVKAQDFDLSSSDSQQLTDVIKNRLNVYGLEDVKVNPTSDLSGNNFVRIEIAGATPSDLENLISQQGKFEAKIGNDTVFIGGNKDVASVGRSGQDAFIESCKNSGAEYLCTFRFVVYLSEDAARKHAEITKNLSVNSTSQGRYLSKPLELYLDDNLVDTLLISENLKGTVTTQIFISGSGSGVTQKDAIAAAESSMHKLQTVLITGSLPYKLEIVKLDTISSALGEEFVYTLFLAGFVSMIAISLIIFVRYRKIKESLAVLFTSFSEIIIILGIAALIGWNLDLPSIAGILATIGTGVDQQIVILDESRRIKESSLKERMKRAIFIVMAAYATALVAMLPLYWAGAGLFRGFALTTIIGITAGVIVSRPAFASMVEKMEA